MMPMICCHGLEEARCGHCCKDEPRGLHPCVGCGMELDGDDPNDRCEDCA